jgi:MFS family permease
MVAFTLFEALYAFSDIVGCFVSSSPDVAIKDLLRSMPLFLMFFMSILILVSFHVTFRRIDEQKWKRTLMGYSIAIAAIAVINIVYIIVGLIVGKYYSLVEGAPSALFPLDSIFYALLGIAIVVANILYIKKYEAKYPYIVPVRSGIVTKCRIVYCIPLVIYLLIALCGFGWALINASSYPMLVEMCSSNKIGKFTGYYYTVSMLAQTVTPILVGIIMNSSEISLRLLYVYSAILMGIAFITILFFKGKAPSKVKNTKKGLESLNID